MEKDIDRIQKNADTDIVIRIDDFGGKVGLTIREFVKSDKYSGFTKAGTRIPADKFKIFKAAINSVDEEELAELAIAASANSPSPSSSYAPAPSAAPKPVPSKPTPVSKPAYSKPAAKPQKKVVEEEIPEQEF